MLLEQAVPLAVTKANSGTSEFRVALRFSDYGYVLGTGAAALEGPSAELGRDTHVIESNLGLSKAIAVA